MASETVICVLLQRMDLGLFFVGKLAGFDLRCCSAVRLADVVLDVGSPDAPNPPAADLEPAELTHLRQAADQWHSDVQLLRYLLDGEETQRWASLRIHSYGSFHSRIVSLLV